MAGYSLNLAAPSSTAGQTSAATATAASANEKDINLSRGVDATGTR
jgi:hypothetical protein